MRSKSSTVVGALHPILFFAGVYVVVLLFSIFICSTIFYSCNINKTEVAKKSDRKATPSAGYTTASIAVVR
ncbi:MAG TPA: hypothetical protein VK588_09070 [Chitinophagaceae bacterium]|nr:hypothetical protein [Chitinophagaceae bacterium]